MLHRYAFENFQSFRDRTELSFRLNGKVPRIPWEARRGEERYSLLCAVMGANGSGKTALLKPLVFAAWFVRASFQQPADAPIPALPHFAAPGEPTTVEFEADDDQGRVWRYVLRLTPQRVLHEALYLKRTSQFSYVFVRDWLGGEEGYGQAAGLWPGAV
ncbi:AAA family ATPase [Roseateles sp.]|uniref:AAA family ATPase n=1 Tax=Roseateles sp. TaxID=1971397 RepID=UPI003927324B